MDEKERNGHSFRLQLYMYNDKNNLYIHVYGRSLGSDRLSLELTDFTIKSKHVSVYTAGTHINMPT